MRPILFQLGPVPLRSYGAMLMVGFLVGLYRAVRVAEKRRLDPSNIVDACLYSLLAGIVGARVVFIMLNWSAFQDDLRDVFSIWQGGLSFHGGVFFAVGAVYAYTRAKRLRFMEMADLLAPSLAIAYGFTRIGCFLNGCCYGVATTLPWGVKFPDLPTPVHPTQLYSSAASFLIFFALTRVEKRRGPEGYVFAAYVGLYCVYRFLIEILRKGATADVALWGLTQAQIVSVVIFIAAAIILWKLRRSESIDIPKRNRV
jgi:phosphatidylglycerol---prolipoprotein diacylglyceryl transferase